MTNKLITTSKAFISHPLILIIITACLSELLFPSWIKRGQDRQAELQVKIELTDLVNSATNEMMMTVQFYVLRSTDVSPEAYDNAYLQWEVDKQIIRTRIQAYFTDPDMLQQWDSLSAAITQLYIDSWPGNDQARYQQYLSTWIQTRDELFLLRDEFNADILGGSIGVFDD